MMDLRPVLLKGLQDEKYPRYNFLKKRLLSIYPRFKTCKCTFLASALYMLAKLYTNVGLMRGRRRQRISL